MRPFALPPSRPLLAGLTAVTFVADYLTPLGIVVWVFYLAPILLCVFSRVPNLALVVSDVLFETASRAWSPHLLGVLFSGTSEDGAAGVAAIRRAGGLAWAESPSVAAVPVMPAAALREAPGTRALTIPEMVDALAALPRRTPDPHAAGGTP